MRYVIFLLLFFGALLGSIPAGAKGLSPNQLAIIQRVLAANGTIAKHDHTAFWEGLPAPSPSELDAFNDVVEHLMLANMRYQIELWRSIKLSYKNKEAVKTAGFENARKSALNYIEMSGAGKDEAFKAMQNGERYLQAAAARETINTPKGPVVFSDELADTVLAGMQGSIARAKILFNPVWTEPEVLPEDQPFEGAEPE